MTLQLIIHKLNEYWIKEGCLIGQPYPGEVGAGTYNPLTFLKVLGSKPWKVGYVELSKRPKDGRYAENPFRMQAFHQYQVILKPSPSKVQEIYLKSLSVLGINLKEHDVRFVEDDWESETLGARGLGWEVWLNGMEITQFTYFQEMGGVELNPVSVEITYGLGRIAMFIQKEDSIFDLEWAEGVKYGEIYKREEYEFCKFNFEEANVELGLDLFARFEEESKRLLNKGLLYPAYDYVLKSSHLLNILDSRNAISPDERKNYIARVRRLASAVAKLYVESEGK